MLLIITDIGKDGFISNVGGGVTVTMEVEKKKRPLPDSLTRVQTLAQYERIDASSSSPMTSPIDEQQQDDDSYDDGTPQQHDEQIQLRLDTESLFGRYRQNPVGLLKVSDLYQEEKHQS